MVFHLPQICIVGKRCQEVYFVIDIYFLLPEITAKIHTNLIRCSTAYIG